MLKAPCRYSRGIPARIQQICKGVVAFVATAMACLVHGVDAVERTPVDLVMSGGTIYTMYPAAPRAEALAISAGRIVAVGSDLEIGRTYRGTEELDLHGQMVLPGFHDAHSHPIYGGVQLAQCDLGAMNTVADLLAKVKGCSDALPGNGWLVGAQWNLGLFPAANPNKALLDSISNRPIFLSGGDGHSAWANSAALVLAGIGRDTPNPDNGVIERDAAGEPSGTLREAAQDLVRTMIPPLTVLDREDGLLRALAMANGYGITSIVEADAGRDDLAAYRALDARGQLTARVVASIGVTQPDADALMHAQDRGTGARLRTDAAKIFVDGVLEGETAALLEPYLDRPGYGGQLKVTPAELTAKVVDLDRRGIQVHMHAIGDRAVRVALDAIEAALSANGPRDNRHHIAHLQLVDPLDRPRFARLGAIANFQGLWAYPDEYITEVNLPQVGQARVDQMYPIASVLRDGARIVGGSDWNASSMNPLLAIETAITRKDPRGRIAAALNESERVSLPDMLAAYTRNGAYLMHQEHDTGTLEVGKLADLVILERNLFDIPSDQIGEVAVTRTVLEGKTVFVRDR
jgi:predicted amidohydrolase YtcJ